MREIKFRGLPKNKDGWRHGWLLKDMEGSTAYYNEFPYRIVWYEGMAHHNQPIITETIGQYTGLTDKNGTEIYEGDIVTVNCYAYEEPEFTVTGEILVGELIGVGLLAGDKATPLWEIQGSYITEYIVIGNICENTELLK